MRFRWFVTAGSVSVLAAPGAIRAQADVIRGRVIAPDSTPVERATITVTSLRGNVSRSTRTDKDGRYTVAFPGSDGDYFVNIAALGYAGKRFEVKRIADQDVLVGNARLAI
ncbi:MAG TPA: carboxypeptidase-like regulatory domain-containing protein, partial [Gemmatimonadaceae bacterium]|nr:carboxypeptidase-like regulatory domain-containing protein [Gemmatimonadaceae bacterium]